MRRTMMATLGLVFAAPAAAQTSVEAVNKNAWQENCGWMNWRDANGGAQGVRDVMTFLSGFIWCENIGWVNVGDGTPANGANYLNATGADFGVNVSAAGNLTGFGWSENAGWINFSGGALTAPPQAARIDLAARRLRGKAWGENIGWINLDLATAGQFVGLNCYVNCDGSTAPPVLNINDFVCFSNRFAAGDPAANCDRSSVPPVLNVNDFVCFQTVFAAGCP